jgi:hypothetical protein
MSGDAPHIYANALLFPGRRLKSSDIAHVIHYGAWPSEERRYYFPKS